MTVGVTFRQAVFEDLPFIMTLIGDAKKFMLAHGNNQWANGYPDEACFKDDLERSQGYLIDINGRISGYMAVCLTGEPAYATLAGKWLTTGNSYGVIHRLALGGGCTGRGIGGKAIVFAEDIMRAQAMKSSRIDTDGANGPMLALLKKLNYQYCGKLSFQQSEKLGFEKLL